jgi:hypothetical protein
MARFVVDDYRAGESEREIAAALPASSAAFPACAVACEPMPLREISVSLLRAPMAERQVGE